jgi:hypothetical protein
MKAATQITASGHVQDHLDERCLYINREKRGRNEQINVPSRTSGRGAWPRDDLTDTIASASSDSVGDSERPASFAKMECSVERRPMVRRHNSV